MRLISDYHTHTVYSRNGHGKGTIAENATAAYENGLKEIGISDHGPGHYIYGVRRENFKEMRQEVDRINREMKDKDFRVLLGVEANLTSYRGEWDLDEETVRQTDIRACGFHYGVRMRSLSDYFLFLVINPLSRYIPQLARYIRRKNTDALIALIEKVPITFLSHPGEKAAVDIVRLAEACAQKGVWLEINAHHLQLDVESIQRAMQVPGVQFVINSDAHHPSDIGAVDAAFERVRAAGLDPCRIVNLKQEGLCKS